MASPVLGTIVNDNNVVIPTAEHVERASKPRFFVKCGYDDPRAIHGTANISGTCYDPMKTARRNESIAGMRYLPVEKVPTFASRYVRQNVGGIHGSPTLW